MQGTYSGGENLDASSTFSYDALGNMKIRGDYGLYRLMYNGNPYRPSHAVVGGDGLVPFSWDAAGSLVEVGANLYQYDGFGRLATATYSNDDTFLDTFAYGHSGSRAYRSHDTLGDGLDPVATYSLGTYEQDSDGAARLFIDAPGRRLAQLTVGSQGAPTVQYLHQDALGSSPLATAPSGDPAALADQDPYGLPRFTKLPDGGPAPTRSYTGKELDPSSWYYFGARYYDPISARFTQIDPLTLQLQGQRNLQGILADPWRYLHPYAYASNNPLTNIDADGNFSLKAALGNIAIGTAGFVYGMGQFAVNTGIGVVNANLHPIQTAKAIAGSVSHVASEGAGLAHDLANDPGAVGREWSQGMSISTDEFFAKSPFEMAASVGNFFGGVELAVGAGGLGRGAAAAGSVEVASEPIGFMGWLGKIRADKGNFGIGAATRAEAERLGQIWAGDSLLRKGGDIIGSMTNDALRVFRLGFKNGLGKWQANFEEYIRNDAGEKIKVRNAHLDILP